MACAASNLLQGPTREARHYVSQPMRGMRRVHEIRIEHDVIANTRKRNTMRRQHAETALHVMHGLWNSCVVQQRAKLFCIRANEVHA